jgi:hypothetical protein
MSATCIATQAATMYKAQVFKTLRRLISTKNCRKRIPEF